MYLFSYMFASYFKFGISIVEIKIKDCFQITCFKAKKNIVVEKNLSVTINLYKKMHFSLSQQIKNIYQSMLYQQHTHWRKSFSQLLYFQRFLNRVKTVRVYFGLYEFSFDFQRREDHNKYFLRDVNSFFYM